MPYMSKFRLVILISGNGSNLQAIIDACANKTLSATIVAVISNKTEAFGITRAMLAGIPVNVLLLKKWQDRKEYDKLLADLVYSYTPNLIVLAGWTHILSMAFLQRFPNIVINLHPALPNSFPGMHAIERAYLAFQNGAIDHTGVMIHMVHDESVDEGTILSSVNVPMFPSDTLVTLSTRVHIAEHKLLLETILNIVENWRPPKERAL